MTWEVISHKLHHPGLVVEQLESPNTSGRIKGSGQGIAKLSNLKFVIIHYTAGRSRVSAVRRFMDDKSGVSAHLVVDRDGTVSQVMPFDKIAWHAGKSSYGKWKGINNYSIGIELVNAGLLTRNLAGNYFAWWGDPIPEKDVFIHKTPKGVETAWHMYTPEQIAVCLGILTALNTAYPSLEYLLGHRDIAPGRKIDPGEAFPMNGIRAAISGRSDDPRTFE